MQQAWAKQGVGAQGLGEGQSLQFGRGGDERAAARPAGPSHRGRSRRDRQGTRPGSGGDELAAGGGRDAQRQASEKGKLQP